uniref:Leucine-rich repeat-containing N-terminal plant-type domain-containing protein n=1 Tax=Fagus sylvatica TaxID=28930 RepID=A0A2N9HLV5_FAGSY
MGKMNQFLLLFLASCFFFISHSQTTSNTSSQHHCLPDQSHTLLQLRQEFVQKRLNSDYCDYYNGSYPKMKSWKADSDCCSWDGVTCDPENGHVVGLNLTNSWLNGRLNSNSSLFSLRHLHKLNLALNNFTSSTIPSQFGHLNMTYLRELHLDVVNISSSLPQSLENLSSLTSLSLSGCSLHGEFPSNIFLLPRIQAIDLSGNEDLTGFLPKFQLGAIPASMGNLSKLTSLLLMGNLFSGELPSSLGNLTQLEELDISENQLKGPIPSEISRLHHLSRLDLSDNSLTGAIPLSTLDLNHNQIQGKIPRSLVQCRMLEVLNLGNNKLNDTFPFWLESLPELQILVLRANGFHGPIWDPATKIGFSKLHVIDLSHNNFTGELPSKYFMTWNAMLMAPVKAIDLSNNRFYGEIPDSVGNLNGLIVLNLSNNSFASHIPSSFGNLTALESLDLSQNLLSGEIPQQLTSLTFLEYLNLSQNHLIGPIPQGGQFSTFQNSSFEGNLGLCGSPLSNKCENNETPTSIPSRDSSFGEGFTWKVVVIGYACGLVIGFLIGHVVISRRPDWFMRTFRVKLHR